MQIDGKSARSGTVLIADGQKGSIELPWGPFELIFQSDGEQAITLTTNPPAITFVNADNPLGVFATFSLTLEKGEKAALSVAMYTIGEKRTNRVIHFTVA